jgi:hypothetical protein
MIVATDTCSLNLEDDMDGQQPGFAGVVCAGVAAIFILVRPFEFAFMSIAMLPRSVPLIAMAPLLLHRPGPAMFLRIYLIDYAALARRVRPEDPIHGDRDRSLGRREGSMKVGRK